MNRQKQVKHLLMLRKIAEQASEAKLLSAAGARAAVETSVTALHGEAEKNAEQRHAALANGDALEHYARTLALEVLDWHSRLQQSALQAALVLEDEQREDFHAHRIASEQADTWLKRLRNDDRAIAQRREQAALDERHLHAHRVRFS